MLKCLLDKKKLFALIDQRNEKSPYKAWYYKKKQKLVLAYEKYIIKGKFFKKVISGFKILAKASTGWIIKLLGFLMLLSVFDKNGSFITSIIGMLSGFIVKAIVIIARMLPNIIRTMMSLVPVIADALFRAASGIREALVNMFRTFGEELPEGSLLQVIMEFGLWILESEGPITKVFKFFKDHALILMKVLVGFLIFSKIAAVLLPVINLLKMLGPALSLLGKGLFFLSRFLFMNPMVAIILGIVVALGILWLWRDKIALFFEGIFDWFNKLGTTAKTVITILAVAFAIFFPIIALVIAAIYGIVKVFQFFSKHGFSKGMEIIWTAISDFFVGIWKSISGFFGSMTDGISNFAISISNFFGGIWKSVSGFFGSMTDGISNFVNGIGSSISGFFGSMTDGISNFVNAIGSFISDFFESLTDGISNFVISIWKSITDFFSSIFNFISSINFSKLGEKIKEVLFNLVDSIIDFFKDIPFIGPVIKFLGTNFKNIFNYVISIFSGFITFFKEIWSSLVGLFSGDISIGEFVGKVWSSIKKSISNSIWSYLDFY